MAVQLKELYFLPPLSIARLGGSDTPLECFHWAESPDIRGAGRTVIRPAVTLQMAADGSLQAYLPQVIQFRDRDKLRPVAPFFELWARVRRDGVLEEASTAEPIKPEGEPLTLDLLHELGVSPDDLRFEITVANKKAQRRTGEPACGFMARAVVKGGDHTRHALLASSPHDAAHVPLVPHDKPIPLGTFQVAMPVHDTQLKVDLSVIRVRYTPAKGEVYGPPHAIASVASPLPEGQNMAWSKQLRGRSHEIVKRENRFLNPDSAWSRYTHEVLGQVDPQPSDSYDGAKNGDQLSWGVVDDTCDGVIQAHLVFKGQRYRAFARVAASPPDYAPDRRMFYSVADDLADRDLPDDPEPIPDRTAYRQAEDDVVDLMTRVFETATQINLDAERHHYVCRKEPDSSKPPHTDRRSMTADDKDYAGRSASGMLDERQARDEADRISSKLQYTKMAEEVHEALMHRIPLVSFLAGDPERVRKLMRPPFGRLAQLTAEPQEDATTFRDPRVERHTKHDMRMPPYMLDSDANPLSLSWRQYRLLMAVVDWLARQANETGSEKTPALARAAAGTPVEIRRRGGLRGDTALGLFKARRGVAGKGKRGER